MAKLFLSAIAIIFVCTVFTANGGTTPTSGGLGEEKPTDDTVTQLVDRLRPDIIKKICDSGKGKCPPSDAKCVANGYKTQQVAGTNYFIRCSIGDEDYHVRIFVQTWTNTEEVTSVDGPKQKTDAISYS